jgi:hypothetical protein
MKLQSKEQRIVGRLAITYFVGGASLTEKRDYGHESNFTDAFDPADLGNTPIFDRH